MSKTYTETHFRAEQSAVIELYYQFCVGEGARYKDVVEVKLGRVSKTLDGPVHIDGIPLLETEEQGDLVLISPRDPTGWCLLYASDSNVGEFLVGLLEQTCPLSMNQRNWDAHLGFEEAIHGFVIEKPLSWGWVRHRNGVKTEYMRSGTMDAPRDKDLRMAFADSGRLFGQVTLDMMLHRLLNVSRPKDIDEYRLMWVRRGRTSWA